MGSILHRTAIFLSKKPWEDQVYFQIMTSALHGQDRTSPWGSREYVCVTRIDLRSGCWSPALLHTPSSLPGQSLSLKYRDEQSRLLA